MARPVAKLSMLILMKEGVAFKAQGSDEAESTLTAGAMVEKRYSSGCNSGESGCDLGNGYCRITTASGEVDKDPAWQTYKLCISLDACKARCGAGCAGVAWTAEAQVDYGDGCFNSGTGRCVVYSGANPATTTFPYRNYNCFTGQGGVVSQEPAYGYVVVPCEGRCHPIQWPYQMGQCYDAATAVSECTAATNAMGGIAFSLQSCYDQPGSGKRYCFMYKNEEPNPAACKQDVFRQTSCTYGTTDGAFYMKDNNYLERFSL